MDFRFLPNNVSTQSPGVMAICGFVTTGAAGVIASSNIPGGGASIAKTGGQTGRYTITVAPPAAGPATLANLTFLGGFACLLGVDSAAMGAGAMNSFWRDDDISTTGAKDGTVELQWATNATTSPIDAEVQNATSFYFVIFVGTPDVV